MQPPPTVDNGAARPRFRIADLEVDLGTAEVSRGDEKIALPKLSFDLLCALINAAPAIVTNDELLTQVWPGLMVSPESVAQRVKLLRSAIGDDAEQPRYILGVRGRGYRLLPAVERLTESKPPTRDATNPSTNTPGATILDGTTSQIPTLTRSNRCLKRGVIAAAILIGLAAMVVLVLRFWSPNRGGGQAPTTAAIQDKSIAVLPFTDMSEKKDQEYFADGMAEEIIDLLVKIPGVKVIGRTSSFAFKGKSEDLRNIGTQLGVAYVLEGSVRKSGEHLRVTAELIDSRDGSHLFSQTYDRDLIDVLKVQDEIAMKVVRSIGDDLYVHEMTSRAALRNMEAYTSYLQGMHVAGRFDQQGFEQAASDFQRALELDPSFAEGSAELASTYLSLGLFGFMPPGTAFEQARNAAEHALELDPTLSDAHSLLAYIHIVYDWDWAAADREVKLARDLAPKGTVILGATALLSLTLGHWDDALKVLTASLERDPLNPSSYFYLSGLQIRRDRLPEAEAAIRRTLDLSETFTFAHYELGKMLLIRGKPQEALSESLKEPSNAGRLIGTALAYFALGRKAESDAAVVLVLKSYAAIPSAIAAIYAFRGESDEAFKWLDRAYAQKDSLLYRIKLAPEFDKLHGDPRYKAFLRKMNLPD